MELFSDLIEIQGVVASYIVDDVVPDDNGRISYFNEEDDEEDEENDGADEQ